MSDTAWIKPGAAAVWDAPWGTCIGRVLRFPDDPDPSAMFVYIRWRSLGGAYYETSAPIANLRPATPEEAAEIERLIPKEPRE